MSVGIVYGSNGGATERIAEMIQSRLGVESELHDIGRIDISKLTEYSHLIIGTSTWGEGELQDDWDNAFDEYKSVEFGGKTVAFFGTGDQEGYSDNFLDAMGTLYEIAINNGATVVGNNWSTDGYEFDESTAIENDAFVGLAIDEDNQDELTEERVDKWIKIIQPHFQ